MWFKFNEHHSKDNLNIELLEAPKILISGKRTEFTDIVGRDGFLSYSDGSYEGFEHTLTCFVNKESVDLDEIFLVLQNGASGELILSNRPDRYHKACVSNKIAVDQFIQNECYEFPVSFRCQPFGYLLSGKSEIKVGKDETLTNLGKLPSYPLIKVVGEGSLTITINDEVVCTVSNCTGEVVIDSFLEECTSNGVDHTYYMTGQFPVLPVGDFKISCISDATVTIQPNWICL